MQGLQQLQKELAECRLCEDIFEHEPKPRVWGKEKAPVMLIGQAPSRKVHETGIPFNDPSGKRLRRWLNLSEKQFWDQELLYITSMAQCFPGKALKGGGDNKPPLICSQTWMSRILEAVKPKMYLLIGSYAARYFYPKKSLVELVFEEQSLRGKPAFILPHPSPLNQKWFKDHPEFEQIKVKEIRQQLHSLLWR